MRPGEVTLVNRIPISFEPLGQARSGIERRHRIRSFIRRTTHNHAVHDCPECINVPPSVRDRIQVGLLGSHIKKSSERGCLFG